MRGMQDVTCNDCGASGTIRIGTVSRGRAKIKDSIPHVEGCSLYKRAQPRHLKNKVTWERQEKRANAMVGANMTLASGAVNEDGDGRLFGEWRVESKQTEKVTFPLRQSVWEKLVKGAMKAGEEPILHLEFRPPGGSLSRRIIVRREWFDALSPDTSIPMNDAYVNAKSYRLVEAEATPHLVQLEPHGVMLYESEFSALKERA